MCYYFFAIQMFKLSEKYQNNIRFLNCDFTRYSPSAIGTINTPNTQININIPREDSVISMLNSYLEDKFRCITCCYW